MLMNWNYIAGFFDGEGSVHVRPNGTGAVLAFYNTNRRVIEEIQSFLGAGVIREMPQKNPRHRTLYSLNIVAHDELLRVTSELVRYSFMKRDQLNGVLSFIKGRSWGRNIRTHRPIIGRPAPAKRVSIQDFRAIRQRLATPTWGIFSQLSREYDLSPRTIRRIGSGWTPKWMGSI